jgi:ubiquinone/menaquinone biosynthesis C-methylase UbiE
MDEKKTMATKSPDLDDKYINWTSREIVEQWSRLQSQVADIYGPATEMMLDMANIKPGYRVLDVAAGMGGQSLLAARRVGANGYVLATDLSASMLNLAAEAVRKEGFTNLETRVMDAENIDIEENSFNAVICRLGLQELSNPSKALRGMHRAMKPGAKISALVFSTAEKNPYQSIPEAIVRRWGGAVKNLFALGESQTRADVFRVAGFSDVAIRAVSIRRHFSSAAEAVRSIREGFFLRDALTKLSDSHREQALGEIEEQVHRLEKPSGVEFPGEMIVAVGTK